MVGRGLATPTPTPESGGEGGDPLADHNEPDTLIEAPIVAGLGYVSCFRLSGSSLDPQAA